MNSAQLRYATACRKAGIAVGPVAADDVVAPVQPTVAQEVVVQEVAVAAVDAPVAVMAVDVGKEDAKPAVVPSKPKVAAKPKPAPKPKVAREPKPAMVKSAVIPIAELRDKGMPVLRGIGYSLEKKLKKLGVEARVRDTSKEDLIREIQKAQRKVARLENA
jgi:hypothetical protein